MIKYSKRLVGLRTPFLFRVNNMPYYEKNTGEKKRV
nr:MAG TPA: hypothetical protein [Caudoviricetes sp.]